MTACSVPWTLQFSLKEQGPRRAVCKPLSHPRFPLRCKPEMGSQPAVLLFRLWGKLGLCTRVGARACLWRGRAKPIAQQSQNRWHCQFQARHSHTPYEHSPTSLHTLPSAPLRLRSPSSERPRGPGRLQPIEIFLTFCLFSTFLPTPPPPSVEPAGNELQMKFY